MAMEGATGHNRHMGDTSPWPKLKSEIYGLLGRNPKSNRMVTTFADLQPSHIVLDIGCGPGAAVRTAAAIVERAVGVDRSEPMIAIATRRSAKVANAEFQAAGAEDLPFPDATFDRVWTIHAFHHWEDQTQGLAESMRVLRPGGWLLIIENDTNGPHGLNRIAAEGLAERLRSLGFDDASVAKPRKELVVRGVLGS